VVKDKISQLHVRALYPTVTANQTCKATQRDLRFSQGYCWRLKSSGMWHCISRCTLVCASGGDGTLLDCVTLCYTPSDTLSHAKRM